MSKKRLKSEFAQARRDAKATSKHIQLRLFESIGRATTNPMHAEQYAVMSYHWARDIIKEYDKRALHVVRTVNNWNDLTFSKPHIDAVRDSMEPMVKLFSGYEHRPDTNQILPSIFQGVVEKLNEPLIRKLQFGTRTKEFDEMVTDCRRELYGTAQAYAEYEFRRRTGYTRELGLVS